MNDPSRPPAVSVVVPVHDAEPHLRPCLDSILGQTLRDLEVVCVDDGSTDDSPAVLREYAARDGRLRVVRQDNASAGAARNRGLGLARGEWVSFLDADDVFEPDMLETALERCRADDLDFAVFRSDQLVSETGRLRGPDRGFRRDSVPPYEPFTFRELTGNVFRTFVGWAWDKLYRRSFVLEAGLRFQEQRTSNDLFFVFSALLAARRIGLVDRVLAHQRVGRRGSLSRTRGKSWRCFRDALAALQDRIVRTGLGGELERDFANYALHFSLWNLDTVDPAVRPALEDALRGGWFREFGLEGRPDSFFDSPLERARFRRIARKTGRRAGEESP